MRNYLLLAVLSIFLFACSEGTSGNLKDAKQTVVKQSSTPEKFKGNLQQLLNHYYNLKNTFVAEDLEEIRKACSPLMGLIHDIDINELNNDELMEWSKEAETMLFLLEDIANVESIEEKRLNFGDLSESVLMLIKSFGIKEGKVFVQFCPMAFNNNGAKWLSTKSAIQNPFFGDEMLECGKIEEIVTFEK